MCDFSLNYERVAEWLKAIDCKSIGKSYVGSNPTSFKKKIYIYKLCHYFITKH